MPKNDKPFPKTIYKIRLEDIQSHRYDVSSKGTSQRAEDRDPGISPVRTAFTSNRQDSMSNTRTQISSRVHGVPSRTAKAHAQSPDEDTDDIRADSWRNGTDLIGENHPDDEHQEEGRNKFAKEVSRIVADSRSRAEDAEF